MTAMCSPVRPVENNITRVDASDLPLDRFLTQFFYKNAPVIIQNAVQHWPFAQWTLDNLPQWLPDQPVTIRNNTNGKLFDTQSMSQSKAQVMLHEFVRLIRNGENTTPLYLAQTSLRRLLQGTNLVLPRFPYLRSTDYLMQSNLWVGTPGLATPAHFDFTHNFYIQIAGHKQITLFSPEDSACLYPNPRFPVVSQVDVGQPDLKHHPRFLNSRPLKFDLGPGEAVFIPAHWWHYIVSCHDNNIAINQWFLRPWSRNLEQAKMIPPLVSHTLKAVFGKKS